jgi:signal transduction histidine kinase
MAMTDPAKLALLLSNLLRNAIEFARHAATIRLEEVGESVVLEVLDDGPGIEGGQMESIFDRFVQISEGSTKCHPGHGLGLSVARACAESIGGCLEALATQGHGAHLRLQFPIGSVGLADEQADTANAFLFEGMETF